MAVLGSSASGLRRISREIDIDAVQYRASPTCKFRCRCLLCLRLWTHPMNLAEIGKTESRSGPPTTTSLGWIVSVMGATSLLSHLSVSCRSPSSSNFPMHCSTALLDERSLRHDRAYRSSYNEMPRIHRLGPARV